MYNVCGEICELAIVVLLPEERFKGYGNEIFVDLFAMNPQIKTIKLDVQQRNKHAIGFYKKLGFQITGEEIQPVNGKDVPYFKMALNKQK